MSDVGSRWAFELQVRGLQKPVVLSLGHRHNGITGACFPSISRIGKDAGYISDDSVRRGLKQLADAQLITIEPRWDGSERLSNGYILHFDKMVLAHSGEGTRTQRP